MAKAKRGIAVVGVNALITAASLNADICVCGHRVDAHDATTEACRYNKQGDHLGVGACNSIRVER